MTLAVNGRFRSRRITGVERYAHEVLSRLEGPVRVIEPPAQLRAGLPGHAWEQGLLPIRVRSKDLLWSPCNFGPAMVKNQVVTIHDLAPLEHPEWFAPSYVKLVAALTPRTVARARAIVVPSRFTADRIRALLGPRCRIEVIQHGSSLPRSPVSRPTGEPFLLAVGTREVRKNHGQLLQALELLGHEAPRVVVVGGAPGATLHAETDAHSGTVDYLGFIDDSELSVLMSSCTALVSLSRYEGFDLPAAEAAALGAPLLLSDIPVHRELFDAATFVPLDDARATAEAIRQVMSSVRRPSQAVSDWDTSARRHSALFAELMP